MNFDLQSLISKTFKKLYLWGSESTYKSLLLLAVIFIFGVPLIGFLQNKVIYFPYKSSFDTLISFFQNNFNLAYYIIFASFLITFSLLFYVLRKLNSFNIIKDNFEFDLSKWGIPLSSSWTLHKCEDVLGKMLRITKSQFPATLKGANAWFDYLFSFYAKIDNDVPKINQKIGIIVRSENNVNGIMLQFEKDYFRPHLLFNGTYFLDSEQDQQLPTILPINEWIKFEVFVKGTNIEIEFEGYKIHYRIPTKDYAVEDYLVSKDRTTLKDLEANSKIVSSKQTELYKKIDEYLALKVDDPNRSKKYEEFDKLRKAMPSTSKITFDYQKGSVGFRESGIEKIFVRNVIVKKIQ